MTVCDQPMSLMAMQHVQGNKLMAAVRNSQFSSNTMLPLQGTRTYGIHVSFIDGMRYLAAVYVKSGKANDFQLRPDCPIKCC